MCGLVGVLAYQDATCTVDAGILTRMRDSMVHRGPDGAGLWISPDRKIGLGHRRLSILDLSTVAGQPMANEDGAIQVVFNGEIYNHADIRAELQRLGGHTWRTDHSDTEVILHAFEQWGEECFQRFRGMFAIALWDGRRRELWLVRDRFGVKPLYWSDHHGRLTFASEIKALLEDPEQKRAVDEEALFHYLSFLTTPAPMTLFAGIRKVPAGCLVKVDANGRREERRWYEMWDHVTPLEGVSEGEICERLRSELETAVRLRGVADVPVGVFLSGGIDSSLNAALFAKSSARQIKTFSIGYAGEYGSYPSELPWARMMAKAAGSEHHEYLISQDDLLGFLPEMVRLQDEPIADPVCVPVYFVSKLSRDNGVSVCQVGEGSDELFMGYPTWHLKHRLQSWSDLPVPRFAKRMGLAGLRWIGKGDSPQYEALRRSSLGQPVFWGGAEAFTEAEKQRLLSPRLRQRFAGRTSWEVIEPIHKRFREKAWEQSTLAWMTHLDLSLRLPELLLMRLDKMCMGVSLEGREPFLDHKLVELALAIPERVKIRGGLKSILKKSIRGIIPDEIIDRPKQGFGVPIQEWVREKLGSRIEDEVQCFVSNSDLLDVHAARGFSAGLSAGKAWYLLNLAKWWNAGQFQS